MLQFDHPELENDAVHVWHLDLQLPVSDPSSAESWLTEDEQLTAAYFRESRHRQRFVAGRVLLRGLLASYLGQEPASLQFSFGPTGKPALVQSSEQAVLHFNYSHSADRAVCAVTQLGPIGVDLEQVQSWEDLPELEPLVFTPSEIELLCRLGEADRRHAFFRLWTHKEALVKATGAGLSLAPETFGVNLEQACLSEAEFEHEAWRFADVSNGDEWPAAIAIACEQFRVLQFA